MSRYLQVLLDLINDRESVTRGGDFLECPIIFVKPHGTQYKKRAQGHRYIKRRGAIVSRMLIKAWDFGLDVSVPARSQLYQHQ